MCKVCTEAVHCVALLTRVTLGLGMCPRQVCTEARDATKNAKKKSPKAKTRPGKKGTKARKGCVSGSANVPVCGYIYIYYIYTCLDLPKGAKWFLNIVNSVSLRVELAPLGRCWCINMCVYMMMCKYICIYVCTVHMYIAILSTRWYAILFTFVFFLPRKLTPGDFHPF